MRFQNKVVIVTGASSGIGASTALLLAREGARVVAVGRNEERLKQVAEAAEKDGNRVLTIKADVANDDDAKRIIKETVDKYGRLDVLVNNAGIVREGSVLDGKLFDTFDEVMNTNYRAAAYLTTLAAPELIKTKGNIVNISSVLGKSFLGMAGFMSYNASKAALDHFSRGAAIELGAHGVRVNTVSPGPVATEILKTGDINFEMEVMTTKTILGRIGETDEVAKLIAFVASDDAFGITGSDFVADNGALIK